MAFIPDNMLGARHCQGGCDKLPRTVYALWTETPSGIAGTDHPAHDAQAHLFGEHAIFDAKLERHIRIGAAPQQLFMQLFEQEDEVALLLAIKRPLMQALTAGFTELRERTAVSIIAHFGDSHRLSSGPECGPEIIPETIYHARGRRKKWLAQVVRLTSVGMLIEHILVLL